MTDEIDTMRDALRTATPSPARKARGIDSAMAAFDAEWLDAELSRRNDVESVIAIHHPPFETGIWWTDCVGLAGAELFEDVVRRHPHVIKVLSGHVHRTIQTNWAGCSLWVSPSTSVTVAGDLHPDHDPAETAGQRSVSTLTPDVASCRTLSRSVCRRSDRRSSLTPPISSDGRDRSSKNATASSPSAHADSSQRDAAGEAGSRDRCVRSG